MLAPILRKQSFQILGMYRVCLLSYEVLYPLHFFHIRSSDLLSHSHLRDIGRRDAIFIRLLNPIFLVQRQVALDLLEESRVAAEDVYGFVDFRIHLHILFYQAILHHHVHVGLI